MSHPPALSEEQPAGPVEVLALLVLAAVLALGACTWVRLAVEDMRAGVPAVVALAGPAPVAQLATVTPILPLAGPGRLPRAGAPVPTACPFVPLPACMHIRPAGPCAWECSP